MSPRLAKVADCDVSSIVLSPEQRKLLTEGDIEGLLKFHSSQFGSAVMEDDEDDDDTDEDEDDDAEDGDDEDEDDGDDGDEDEDDKDKAKGKKKADPKDVRIQEVSAEAKKYRLKSSARGKRIAELERENAALKAAGGKKTKKDDDSDKETDTDDAATAEAARKLEEANRDKEDLLIRLEFMANNKHSWKNPKAALKLLDLSDVEIDEDGEIEGLEEAIDQLAKDEPYLLDTTKQDKADSKTRRRGATGQATGGKRKAVNANRTKLENKYPALRR